MIDAASTTVASDAAVPSKGPRRERRCSLDMARSRLRWEATSPIPWSLS